MKLSDHTLTILRSFSSINSDLVVKKGNVLRTIADGEEIFARATVPDQFDKDFAIRDLPRLLAAYTIIKDPDLQLHDTHLTLTGDQSGQFRYPYASHAVVKVPPEGTPSAPGPSIEFDMTADQLSTVLKALGPTGAENISLLGNNEGVVIEAMTRHEQGGNNQVTPSFPRFAISLGQPASTDFTMVFNSEKWKNIIIRDYHVVVTRLFVYLKSDVVEYWFSPLARTSKIG